jgi:hypothetical protein
MVSRCPTIGSIEARLTRLCRRVWAHRFGYCSLSCGSPRISSVARMLRSRRFSLGQFHPTPSKTVIREMLNLVRMQLPLHALTGCLGLKKPLDVSNTLDYLVALTCLAHSTSGHEKAGVVLRIPLYLQRFL